MLVLIIVGNTNQRGTFCCSWLRLCFFLSASFRQIFSVPHLSEFPGGYGAFPGSRGWARWGRSCLGVSVAGTELLQPRVPSGSTAHDGSSWLPDAGAASCLPPCPKPLPLGTSIPLCSVPAHPRIVPSPPASCTGGTGCTLCILYHFNEGAHCPV